MPGRGQGRSRGRGGTRGRGASRGRGRKHSSRGRQAQKRSHSPDEFDPVPGTAAPKLDLDSDVKAFFRGTVTFDDHFRAQEHNRDRYAAGMAVLGEMGVDVSQNARVRALAAAWARHDHDFANLLLSDRDNFGLVEVLKALTMLDSARLVRVNEKRMKRLQDSKTKVRPTKLGKIKSDIDNLNKMKPDKGSVSGALCRHIKKWVRSFTQSELEFFALYFPKDSWVKLADICHLNPSKDFPELPWFLPFCFGKEAPHGTMVHRCGTVTSDNVNSLVLEFDIPYTYLHKLKLKLSTESLARVARYTPSLDTLLWYYEDLQSADVDAIILKRLHNGDKVTLAIGKVLERLLTLSKMLKVPPFFDHLTSVAEPMLTDIRLELPSPIVVIGDRSASMHVAINTSVIIAGILTALTSAKLVFFNNVNTDAPFLPKNISDVLELSKKTTAECSTAPAASLWPFYSKQEIVKTFIIVTDEEENTEFEHTMFAPLFKKYHAEVYPARLVFVSFLSQHKTGDMIRHLSEFNPMQFVLDRNKPDLTKLDTLFGLLSSEGGDFNEKVERKTTEIRDFGLQKVFKSLKVAPESKHSVP